MLQSTESQTQTRVSDRTELCHLSRRNEEAGDSYSKELKAVHSGVSNLKSSLCFIKSFNI